MEDTRTHLSRWRSRRSGRVCAQRGLPSASLGPARLRRTAAALTAAIAAFVALVVLSVEGSLALGPSTSYSLMVFSDGFESGSLSAWDGTLGPGSASVIASAARNGA